MLPEDVKKGILAGLRTAGEKAAELSRIGKIKIDIFSVKKEIEDKLVELGGRVYEYMVKNDPSSIHTDHTILSLVGELKELEAELNRYTEELEKPRQHDSSRYD
jgi:hypothetical protein